MQRKRVFSSEVTKDGKVRITVFRKNGEPVSADIPPEAVPMLACMMLQDAQEASGEPEPQCGFRTADPSSGISGGSVSSRDGTSLGWRPDQGA